MLATLGRLAVGSSGSPTSTSTFYITSDTVALVLGPARTTAVATNQDAQIREALVCTRGPRRAFKQTVAS